VVCDCFVVDAVYQDEYADTGNSDLRSPYCTNQPVPTSTHPAQYHHGRPPRAVYTELASSVPCGLDSMPQRRLLQYSHSLPSSPQKLQPHLPAQYATDVYRTGSFTDMSYNVADKLTPSRSKVLPKEVSDFQLSAFSGLTLLVGCQEEQIHTHTQPFNGPFSRTTRVSWYQKDKTSLDLTEARDSE